MLIYTNVSLEIDVFVCVFVCVCIHVCTHTHVGVQSFLLYPLQENIVQPDLTERNVIKIIGINYAYL